MVSPSPFNLFLSTVWLTGDAWRRFREDMLIREPRLTPIPTLGIEQMRVCAQLCCEISKDKSPYVLDLCVQSGK